MKEMVQDILIEESASYARIIFNRPHARNAFTSKMWTELPALVRRLQSRRGIRAVILSGTGGKAFSTGTDIGELPHFADAKAARAYESLVVRALNSLANCPLPVIAMIQGHAMGGGCHIALACDLRIVGESAQFGIPVAKLGGAVNPGVLARLVNLVGPAVAKELLFGGRPLNAERALEVGLVNQVVPDADLEGFTLSFVRQITSNAPLTVRHAKQSVNWVAMEGRREPPKQIRQGFVKAFTSSDFKEGLNACLSGRPAKFQGR
jgi:enoyl-CoA hydratase/carnithine racemase